MLTVFLELRSRNTMHFSEQILSSDIYLSIFSRQMEAIVHLYKLILTSEANDSLFFSPPEIPRSLPGIPMYVSAHLVRPSFKRNEFLFVSHQQ